MLLLAYSSKQCFISIGWPTRSNQFVGPNPILQLPVSVQPMSSAPSLWEGFLVFHRSWQRMTEHMNTEQQCHPDSSGYFFSIWRDRLFSWALANPNNNWWWNEKAYSMRSLRFGWIKFDKAPWLQMLQCQGVMWQTSCLVLLEIEGLGSSKQGGGKGEFGEQALAFGACGETHRRGGPASLSTQRPGIWLEFVSAVFSKFCDKKIVLLCLWLTFI